MAKKDESWTHQAEWVSNFAKATDECTHMYTWRHTWLYRYRVTITLQGGPTEQHLCYHSPGSQVFMAIVSTSHGLGWLSIDQWAFREITVMLKHAWPPDSVYYVYTYASCIFHYFTYHYADMLAKAYWNTYCTIYHLPWCKKSRTKWYPIIHNKGEALINLDLWCLILESFCGSHGCFQKRINSRIWPTKTNFEDNRFPQSIVMDGIRVVCRFFESSIQYIDELLSSTWRHIFRVELMDGNPIMKKRRGKLFMKMKGVQ